MATQNTPHPEGEAVTTWQPADERQRIGYVEGESLFLLPEMAYSTVQQMAQSQQGVTFVQQRTLWKHLHEAGLLSTRDAKRERYTVRRMVAGARLELLHMQVHNVLGTEPPSQPSQPSQDNDSPEEDRGETLGRSSVVTVPVTNDRPTTVPRNHPAHQRSTPHMGRLGRLGRSLTHPTCVETRKIAHWVSALTMQSHFEQKGTAMTANFLDLATYRRHHPEAPTPPRLAAYLQHCADGVDSWCVWCVACRVWHSHGAAGGAGHRVAHCWTPAGRRRYARGYTLVPAGRWADVPPRQRRYGPSEPRPRTCSERTPPMSNA